MRFWVDKEQEKKPDGEWKDAYVFSINRKQYSTIFTNITNSWYRRKKRDLQYKNYSPIFFKTI